MGRGTVQFGINLVTCGRMTESGAVQGPICKEDV
jgi:hypothetical protein